jgi:glycosyltransferase involved in cell wall biosynthesis
MSAEPPTAPDPSGTPLPVSVVIPVYNRAEMIGRAVRSVLGQQSVRPAEVLVVDDGSSDETGDRATAAGARVITHEANRGEGAARNTGIDSATQPWIALLDSDDEWMPNLLSLLWPVRDTHIIVGGGSLHCGAEPRRDRYSGPTGQRPLIIRSPSALIYPENFIAASGTMVRRDIVQRVGGYAEGMRGAADMDLWIRVLEHGTALIIPRPVVIYNLHGGQVTTDADLMARSHRAAALRYADRGWWRPEMLEMWEGVRIYDSLRRSVRERNLARAAQQGAQLLRSPRRVIGVVRIVGRRVQLARRSGLFDRHGEPTVTVCQGAPAARTLWRPPSRAVVSSQLARCTLRLAGVSQVSHRHD